MYNSHVYLICGGIIMRTMRKVLVSLLSALVILTSFSSSVFAATYYTGWEKWGDYWYYYFWDEYLTDAWLNEYGSDYYYYFDDQGRMVTGWKKLYGDWFYFESDGHLGSSGWRKFGNTWYYFEPYSGNGGVMVTGVQSVDGALYYFGTDGAMRSNTWGQDAYGDWYYFGSDGQAESGWKKLGGNWYFLNPEMLNYGFEYIGNGCKCDVLFLPHALRDDIAMAIGEFH